MLDFFDSGSKSEREAKNLAREVKKSLDIIDRNSREIRGFFNDAGFEFDKAQFKKSISSMFSMLAIDNFKKQKHYDLDEAVEAFMSHMEGKHTMYVDVNRSFKSSRSEDKKLKVEAATWAARKYFGGKPTNTQAKLFFERAKKFVDFMREFDAVKFKEE